MEGHTSWCGGHRLVFLLASGLALVLAGCTGGRSDLFGGHFEPTDEVSSDDDGVVGVGGAVDNGVQSGPPGIFVVPPSNGSGGQGGAQGTGGEGPAQGVGGSEQGSGGSGGSPPAPLFSEFCPDTIRDPVLEDCDAGPGGSIACSPVCQVLDFLLVEPPEAEGAPVPTPVGRRLGTGRHPASATLESLAVAFFRTETETSVHVQLFDDVGNRLFPVEVSQGAVPVRSANPVVAGLPNGSFAVAWNDLAVDGSELGVALRRISPEGELSPVRSANATAIGAQFDPDLVLAWPGEVVVAWTDTSDATSFSRIVARTFDAQGLQPSSGEMVLGGGVLPASHVVLSPHGLGWAAAWREAQPDGSEKVVVFSYGATWSIDVAQPGPADDKPGIAELDDEHLLLVYSEGTDPLQTGVAQVPRLAAAVIDTVHGTVQLLGALDPLVPPFAGSTLEALSVGQRQPGAMAVGQRVFVSWASDAWFADAGGQHVWLKELSWNGASQELSLAEEELPLPRREAHRVGDQMRPALAATPLHPEGALLMAWEDYGVTFHPHQGRPDVAAQLAPVPLRRGPPVVDPPEEARLIEDFEDGDDWILEHEGRVGQWYTFDDGTGTMTPSGAFAPSTPGYQSNYAGRVLGSGFTSWGAGIGFDLVNDGAKQTYDASTYLGVTFRARAESPVTIRLDVTDVNTDPDGGVCTNCFDHHGIDLALSTSWAEYTITWTQLQQLGWGDAQSGVDPTQLYALQFKVGTGISFDFWIDDIAFVPPEPPSETYWLVDDLEDGDDWLVEHEGRVGRWHAFNDGTGTQTPSVGVGNFTASSPGRASTYAARTSGSNFSNWGAGIGFDFNDDGGGKQTYDASEYLGVTFWARAESPLTIRFNVSDANTDAEGGICGTCFDHHGLDLALTTGWEQYTFTWGQLHQIGWGDAQNGLDTTQLFGMLFQVGASTTFDFWVDDVSLIPDVTELVDDLEDGDAAIPEIAGRQGNWITYNDGTGTQTPPPSVLFTPDSPGLDSSYAARTFGSGFTSWGATLAVELNRDSTTKATYDASDYIGVSFWARAAGTLPVRFMVSDINTDSDGNVCSNCFDHFGADITLDTTWQRYVLTWWQLDQQGWGDQFAGLDIEHIFGLHFQTPPNQSFDVWVDDVELISGGGPF